jgi:hypothetical protein
MEDLLAKAARERAMPRLLRAQNLSAEVEVQFLDGVQGGRPLVEIWHRLRDEAAEAMVALVLENAEDIPKIRDLQRKALMFDDFTRLARAILQEGKDAESRISDLEVGDMRNELVGDADDELAAQLGLEEDNKDA